MILAVLLLLGALGLLGYGVMLARRAGGEDWVLAPGTRLLVTSAPGWEAPQLTLEAAEARLFGPVPVHWAPPPGEDGAPVPNGGYRVLDVADLRGEAPFGTGNPKLEQALRAEVGVGAMILAPLGGGPPLLLHAASGPGSVAGLALEAKALHDLLRLLGDPRGLHVEVLRRSIRRGGWGGRRSGQ